MERRSARFAEKEGGTGRDRWEARGRRNPAGAARRETYRHTKARRTRVVGQMNDTVEDKTIEEEHGEEGRRMKRRRNRGGTAGEAEAAEGGRSIRKEGHGMQQAEGTRRCTANQKKCCRRGYKKWCTTNTWRARTHGSEIRRVKSAPAKKKKNGVCDLT